MSRLGGGSVLVGTTRPRDRQGMPESDHVADVVATFEPFLSAGVNALLSGVAECVCSRATSSCVGASC